MPREELDPNYASPGMRWGMFLVDHPNGEERFYKATAAELKIPEDFSGETGEFVVAEIDAKDGSPTSVGYKEIPKKIQKYVGGQKRDVDFERDPENWQTLCTKALGRALKRFGYPDNVVDLKAVMAWRRSTTELKAALEGRVLQIGTGKKDEQAILDAGAAQTEGETGEETEERADVIDTTATDATKPPASAPTAPSQNLDDVDHVQWHPDLIDLVDKLAKAEPDSLALVAVAEFCKQRDINPLDPGIKLRTLRAFIESRLPKEKKPEPEPPKAEPEPEPEPAKAKDPDADPATLLSQRQAELEAKLDRQTPEGLERVTKAITEAGFAWPPPDLDTCALAEDLMEKHGEIPF